MDAPLGNPYERMRGQVAHDSKDSRRDEEDDECRWRGQSLNRAPRERASHVIDCGCARESESGDQHEGVVVKRYAEVTMEERVHRSQRAASWTRPAGQQTKRARVKERRCRRIEGEQKSHRTERGESHCHGPVALHRRRRGSRTVDRRDYSRSPPPIMLAIR